MTYHADIENILADIRGDKSEGATSLALRGLDAIEAMARDLPEDLDEAKEALISLAATIDSLRPSMAAIGNQAVLAVNRALSLIGEGMEPAPAISRAVTAEREILGQANTTIAALAASQLDRRGRVVSCSWSVTALTTIRAIEPSQVVIGEGHRMGDGLRASRWLAARGLDVTVVPDGALPTVVQEGSLVLVGADQVLADGSVVNRCSTYSLALAAKHRLARFVVACQRIKLCGNAEANIEEHDNLFGALPEGVTARAPIFDLTPPDLIDSILTESGRLTPEQAGAVGVGIASLRKRVLGS